MRNRYRILAYASACLALVSGGLLGGVSAGATPTPATRPVTLQPFDLGGVPMSSASQCPARPPMVPSGAIVSTPSLVPTTSPLTLAGEGQTISLARHCTWTVSSGSAVSASAQAASPAYTSKYPKVTYVFAGKLYQGITSPDGFTVENIHSNKCSIEEEGGNIGTRGYSKIKNNSGYCNTSQVAAVTYTISTSEVLGYYAGTSKEPYDYGGVCTTRTFGSYCSPISEAANHYKALVWTWEACVETPIGKNTHFICTYATMGPFN
jgi:hypothetical protein